VGLKFLRDLRFLDFHFCVFVVYKPFDVGLVLDGQLFVGLGPNILPKLCTWLENLKSVRVKNVA
jgi:hypothetical protein